MVKNDIYSAGCKQTKCPLKKKQKQKTTCPWKRTHTPSVQARPCIYVGSINHKSIWLLADKDDRERNKIRK